MKVEITFYTQKDPDFGFYLAHSSLSLMSGTGGTPEEAIQSHLNRFMSQTAASKLEQLLFEQPGIEIKKFTFQGNPI